MTPGSMGEDTGKDTGHQSEEVAERIAIARGEHSAMKAWFNGPSPSAERCRRKTKREAYPTFWQEAVDWEGWRAARRAYLRYMDGVEDAEDDDGDLDADRRRVAQHQDQPQATAKLEEADLGQQPGVIVQEEEEKESKGEETRGSVRIGANASKHQDDDGSNADVEGTHAGGKSGAEEKENAGEAPAIPKKKKRSRWSSSGDDGRQENSSTPKSAEGNSDAPPSGGAPAAKRRSRWARGRDETPRTEGPPQVSTTEFAVAAALGSAPAAPNVLGGLLPTLPSNLTEEKREELSKTQKRLREINERLASLDVEAARVDALPHDHPDRSPSPPPVYGPDGKRKNTRAVRWRERFTNERQDCLEKIVDIMGSQSASGADAASALLPPGFIRRKRSRRIHIPVEQHPTYNFIGLIIGPRGKTQKEMEAKTGCKIAIRGKGSVKEGARGRRDGRPMEGDDDPLHVVITGDDQASVDAAATMIEDMLVVIDDDKNLHKQQQLRELALLNGTLKDEEYCTTCAEKGHRSFECPKRFSLNNTAMPNIKCAICGDTSHPTRDCVQKKDGSHDGMNQTSQNQLDSEYQNFMDELEGGPAKLKKNEETAKVGSSEPALCQPVNASATPADPTLPSNPSAPVAPVPPPPSALMTASIPAAGLPPTASTTASNGGGAPPPPPPPPPPGSQPLGGNVTATSPGDNNAATGAVASSAGHAGQYAFQQPQQGTYAQHQPGFPPTYQNQPYGSYGMSQHQPYPYGGTGHYPQEYGYTQQQQYSAYYQQYAGGHGYYGQHGVQQQQFQGSSAGSRKGHHNHQDDTEGWDYRSYFGTGQTGGDAGGAGGFNWWEESGT